MACFVQIFIIYYLLLKDKKNKNISYLDKENKNISLPTYPETE